MANKNKAAKPSPVQTQLQQDEVLKAKRELFCQYYTSNSETFGNATHSYAEAYEYKLDELSHEPTRVNVGNTKRTKKGPSEYDKAYNVCGVEGNRLLKSPKIQARIRELLNALLKDDVVDSELSKLILQDDDKPTKRQAISEYNKLRGRIIDKTKIVSERFSMDDIRALLAPLPQERQDHVYDTLANALAEAELLRGGTQTQSGDPQQPR